MKDISTLSSHLSGKEIAEARIEDELFLRFSDGTILRVFNPYRLRSDHHHSPEQALISRSVTGVRAANGFLYISIGPMIELAVDLRDTASPSPEALVLNIAEGGFLAWN